MKYVVLTIAILALASCLMNVFNDPSTVSPTTPPRAVTVLRREWDDNSRLTLYLTVKDVVTGVTDKVEVNPDQYVEAVPGAKLVYAKDIFGHYTKFLITKPETDNGN